MIINGRNRELEEKEYVVFVDGGKERKAGWLEARWNRKEQAWWVTDDNGERIWSNDVRVKAPKKKANRSNNAPMVEIHPDTSTEKAYGIVDGTNGCVTKGNMKVYYKWVAKSICKVEDGKVYAPIWAVK